jgi:hypothetical protein
VLIVEPGAFRTSFNGPGALLVSTPIPAYDEQIEPRRTGMPDDDGRQPGDPAKAAAAILVALNSAGRRCDWYSATTQSTPFRAHWKVRTPSWWRGSASAGRRSLIRVAR